MNNEKSPKAMNDNQDDFGDFRDVIKEFAGGATMMSEPRFRRIIRAYERALGGGDASDVDVVTLLPAIFAAVPDTTVKEIIVALRVASACATRKADRIEQFRQQP